MNIPSRPHPRAAPARLLLAVVATLLVVPGTARGGPEYWVVDTRECPQVLGSDPGAFLRARRLGTDARLVRLGPAELIRSAVGRPVVVLVHGSYYSAEVAANEGLRIRDDLAAAAALAPESVVVEFDWPSQRTLANPVRDANDKARRAFVAGYHLARFLGGLAEGSRITLIGHSHGGLATLSALHLLGGGILDDGFDATSLLQAERPSLRLRGIVIASASDRQWLDPGERLDRALLASEGILCLYNPLDPVLVVHPFGRYSDHQRAIGKAGLRGGNNDRLGTLASRYRERNIGPLIGARHTFRGSTANPLIARWIACYTWAAEPACPTRDAA